MSHPYRQKVLKPMNKKAEKKENIVGQDKILKDCLVVRKIPEKELNENCEPEDPCVSELTDKDLFEGYQTVVRKQIQMLQADERGRVALNNELKEMRRLQEKKAQVLNARRKALETEKERARKIASLPVPLPKSIQALLKERDIKESTLSDIGKQNFDFKIEGTRIDNKTDCILVDMEEKENIRDREGIWKRLEKERIQAERNMNAQKRYDEALKKDRLSKEYSETIKQIETAEQANRRLQAKSVSSMVSVPCSTADKLTEGLKQVAMENAVEKIYKDNPKEHIIDELEGYEDKWEANYKKLDTNMNNKMIDCVPKFVRENYSYLLEDESSYQCGKRFSGLNDKDLNTAYIESPTDTTNKATESVCEDIDVLINKLDKMRAKSDAAYQNEFLPLLHKRKEYRKPIVTDKAVETHILRQPTIDKSVENCNILTAEKIPSEEKCVQVDLTKCGVMNFKRKNEGTIFKSYINDDLMSRPYSKDKDQVESKSPWKSSPIDNWSSSSYMSLPSNHGMPKFCKLCDSPNCNLPICETQHVNDCIPLSKAPQENINIRKIETKVDVNMQQHSYTEIERDPNPITEVGIDTCVKTKPLSEKGNNPNLSKSQLSYYIQKVASKYLNKKSADVAQNEKVTNQVHRFDSLYNVPSFEQRVNDNQYLHDEVIDTKSDKKILEHSLDSDPSSKLPVLKNEFLQNPQVTPHSLLEFDNEFNKETIPKILVWNGTPEKQHNYHELSTIHEMDSALTNPNLSDNDISAKENKSINLSHRKSHENVNISNASLINIPYSDVSDLARNIKFTEIHEPEAVDSSSQSLISGTVTQNYQFPTVASNLITTTTGPSPLADLLTSTTTDRLTPTAFEEKEETPKLSPSLYMTPSNHSYKSDTSISSEHLLIITAETPRTPYSSSFRDPHKMPPYLTYDSLPRYFEKDISTVKHSDKVIKYQGGFERTPLHIETTTTTTSQKEVTKLLLQMKDIKLPSESSSGSFKVLTSHSNISSINDEYQQNTKDSYKNSANNIFQVKEAANCSLESSSDSFKQLTPRSYISSLKDISKEPISINEGKKSNLNSENKSDKLKLSTPNPTSSENLTPLVSPNNQLCNYNYAAEGEESFYPLTPQSDISSLPESDIQEAQRSSHPDVLGIPTSISKESDVKLPGSQEFFNYHCSSGDGPQLEFKNPEKIESEFNFKVPYSRKVSIQQKPKFDKYTIAQECKSNFLSLELNEIKTSGRNITEELKLKANSNFTSHLTNDDYHSFKNEEIAVAQKRTIFQSLEDIVGFNKQEFSKKQFQPLHLSKSDIIGKVNNFLECEDVAPTISSGSSCDGISASKINFQSTPFKKEEDLIQEHGILEESDLTLFKSEMTIKIESPVKNKVKSNCNKKIVQPVLCALKKSEMLPSRHCLSTPESSVLSSPCTDSPSMMSFLRHEISCFSNDSPEAMKASKIKIQTPGPMSDKIEKKGKGHSNKKTPGKEYRSRSKRLWENLEEVKSRKLMEDKKEQLKKNRQKMLAYSKKRATPRKKD